MKSSNNRTLDLSDNEIPKLRSELLLLDELPKRSTSCLNRTIHADCLKALEYLPHEFVDLLILDPPYNMSKTFGSERFSRMSAANYTQYIRQLYLAITPLLKHTATIYTCCDMFSSSSVYDATCDYFKPRSRITWEREKGRGSQTNWKNSCEDIWFSTVSDQYTFNVDSVKLRRKVIAAPYYAGENRPKDWRQTGTRDTCPSNLWTDITVPFWSMPENTDHPTQKPEKLIAKLILASSNPGDVVLDPMCGSGTTSVVAKKLGRNYIGIEADEHYAMLTEKRLALAETDKRIQGYSDGIFWERNSIQR